MTNEKHLLLVVAHNKKSPATKSFEAYGCRTSEGGTLEERPLSLKSHDKTQLLRGLLSQNMAWW